MNMIRGFPDLVKGVTEKILDIKKTYRNGKHSIVWLEI